jgi:hypothetical protein
MGLIRRHNCKIRGRAQEVKVMSERMRQWLLREDVMGEWSVGTIQYMLMKRG